MEIKGPLTPDPVWVSKRQSLEKREKEKKVKKESEKMANPSQ